MELRDGKSGNRPIIATLIIAPLALGLLWCFYDAYWPRPLTLEAIYQVGGKAELLDGQDSRVGLHLPHPTPQQALLIDLNNRSRFFLRGARVVFVTKDAEDGILTIEEAPCLHLGNENLRVPPRVADAATVHHCAAALSEKSSRAMLGAAFVRYEWYFSELQGHRAPIRLIRRPLEVFSLMFERIYD